MINSARQREILKKTKYFAKKNKMLPNKTVFKYYIIGLGKKER